ncbi:MAG: polysaccharide deacetylase family protein [Proteobacteria bacterium]|nr:polysaccharide deacetylase family protein [Pseudomonadota bacterium]
MSSILLSVDLEDVRDWVKDGVRYREGVPENTRSYLDQFKRWGVRATFFVVGEVARRYPRLIGEIVGAGHELACHGDVHLQLDKLTPKEFRADMRRNLAALENTGGKGIEGFRAPTFSLTAQTAWAHEVLAELGFAYSSSVLPAGNPLYGWPEFGRSARKVAGGLWELPVTLHEVPGLSVPIAGGVYFRVLPFFLTKWAIGKSLGKGRPVVTYFHPYDVDTKQERFMHPDLGGKNHLNMLMYIGRAKVLKRLDILHRSYIFQAYGDYVKNLQSHGVPILHNEISGQAKECC